MFRFKETLPLTVKCSYEGRSKRVYLQTVADMCYGTLKRKVEETVVLSAAVPFIIRYLDDESKEYCTIADDQELHEAVKYFSSGFDDLPVSSNASTQSGRSRSSKKVGLEVEIVRDCDVSLSDSGSLASLEEYRERNLSNRSLTFPDRGEPEDDCVTVSSRNPQSEASLRPSAATRRGNSWLRLPRLASKSSKLTRNTERASSRNSSTYEESRPTTSQDNLLSVFERLKLEEDGPTPGVQPSVADDRRVAWVQEQQRQKLMPWAVNRSSEGDDEASSLDLGSQLDGDFELERASSGRYYYSYTSSQAYDDDGTQISGLPEALRARPSSMQLDWLADQQAGPSYRRPTHVQSAPSFYTASTDTLTQSRPPEDILTDCSKCHNLLDTFRYVCVICGPKTPLQHIPDGGKDSQIPTSFNYPPPQRRVLSDPPLSCTRIRLGYSRGAQSRWVTYKNLSRTWLFRIQTIQMMVMNYVIPVSVPMVSITPSKPRFRRDHPRVPIVHTLVRGTRQGRAPPQARGSLGMRM
ncbi:hypothetical protein BD779DRAFT_338293 [Infundibulicybe gibba]|nr:hypothetical protein BD779DRAFT_338293 [Infundibulicybe gibba]